MTSANGTGRPDPWDGSVWDDHRSETDPWSTPAGDDWAGAAPPGRRVEAGSKRQAFLTKPGDELLLSAGPIDHAVHYVTFAERTGLGVDNLCSSVLCELALPRSGLGAELVGRPEERARRCVGWEPSMLWHPLFWLPRRLAGRYQIAEDGELESDDAWAVRVALELTISGVYEAASGTWLDVTSGVGVDVGTPEGLRRAADWLAGRPDPGLDAVDLDGLITDTKAPDWAASAAHEMLPGLHQASWALGADSLLDVLDGLADDVEQGEMTELAAVAQVASTVAAFGAIWAAGAPRQNGESPAQILSSLEAVVAEATGIAELMDGPVANIADVLLELRDQFWPAMERRIAELLIPVPE